MAYEGGMGGRKRKDTVLNRDPSKNPICRTSGEKH